MMGEIKIKGGNGDVIYCPIQSFQKFASIKESFIHQLLVSSFAS